MAATRAEANRESLARALNVRAWAAEAATDDSGQEVVAWVRSQLAAAAVAGAVGSGTSRGTSRWAAEVNGRGSSRSEAGASASGQALVCYAELAVCGGRSLHAGVVKEAAPMEKHKFGEEDAETGAALQSGVACAVAAAATVAPAAGTSAGLQATEAGKVAECEGRSA